ncbi:cationic amino acid transporter 4-like isoform X2 [Varroa jacobsoni]|uniref:cationic amino acid transporter 4-like isoform X2 n=1 Tax=Varroa jacobsoni TaxID=62625 RepID=UPI000BF4A6F3|nr:cationic amino acid transporter 4-like isoform X2 [Varroa jacobsoni]
MSTAVSTRLQRLASRISRRKMISGMDDLLQTRLKRSLSTFDITLLGIGHMIGSGIYVISPEAARKAGPACVISYVIAGIASMLAALAYAEFAVRFPRAGSSYSYVYFSVGEFVAFIVGWNVLLENTLALSIVAQTCGAYIDSITNYVVSNFVRENVGRLVAMPANSVNTSRSGVTGLVTYLNTEHQFLVLVLMAVFVVIVLLKASRTLLVGNVLCGLSICLLIIIIGIGIFKGNFYNWTNSNTGGFLARGWQGVFNAASICFFSYGGFDAISAAAEEAKDPRRSMPIATIIAMLIVTMLYTAVAGCLTLLRNWTQIRMTDGFPEAMNYNGIYWAQYIITAGALCGMTAVAVVTLYTVVRISFSMAEDGLICPLFAKISKRSQVPQYSTLMFAGFSALVAMFFNTDTTVDMLSIGTLTAYMMVTCGLISNRFTGTSNLSALRLRYFRRFESHLSIIFNQRTYIFSNLIIIILTSFGMSFFIQGLWTDSTYGSPILLSLLLVTSTILLAVLQEVPDPYQSYKMPLMPWLAVVSLVFDSVLISTLPSVTWIRFLVWLTIVGRHPATSEIVRSSKFDFVQ